MNRNLALQKVKAQLTNERYEHTLRVLETAISLANQFGVNVKQVELAAIFHDYAKFRPKEEMKQIIIAEKMPQVLLGFHHELWHAPVGAFLVETELGMTDEAVLNAIRYHTTGRQRMTMLEKVIYVADYIEPGRDFPGVDEIRKVANQNLDQALFFAIRKTILFLLQNNRPVYPDTFQAYNYFILNNKEDLLNE